MTGLEQLIYIDALSLIMMSLVGFVSVSIAAFSWRYLSGDRKRAAFYRNLLVLTVALFIMVSADHIVLLLVTWTLSNWLLTRLMLHKAEWRAARQSAILARKNFLCGLALLGSAFLILFVATGTTSIQALLSTSIDTPLAAIAMVLLVLAAVTQSALWPFHRWLTSASNSPTPVSAIMHAGLINGGGFLLVRFAPMVAEQPFILTLLFVAGILTAMVGTVWKLMQSDVKRMLACSTMGQMGFMVAQCGLGLFPAAVAHLCWHGLFKAYLFLASGSAAQEQRLDLCYPPTIRHLFLALLCGALGAYVFALMSGKTVFIVDTTLFLIVLALIAGAQLALPIIRGHCAAKLPLAAAATAAMGAVYGVSVGLIETILAPLNVAYPQPLTMLHIVALIVMTAAWLAVMFGYVSNRRHYPDWLLKSYVRMLNASQPHPATVTAHRNHYHY